MAKAENHRFYNRDLSWLSFNQRILEESANSEVPTLERINFLAIYSSNLDEFYRVRMPVLTAIKKIYDKTETDKPVQKGIYKKAKQSIHDNQDQFGHILTKNIIPELKKDSVHLVYNEFIPQRIVPQTENYFFSRLAAFIEKIYLKENSEFFPANNQLYFLISFKKNGGERLAIINIPSDRISRFYTIEEENTKFVLFIDDIIRQNLSSLFRGYSLSGAYSFKVTRNADLELENEYEGDLTRKIEEQIQKRDFGLATRILYQPDIPRTLLKELIKILGIQKSSSIPGGNYHNLKDLFQFPIKNKAWKYPEQFPVLYPFASTSLLAEIQQQDVLINTPYESYDTVLRFFNEAAFDENVEEIYTTIYRVAKESQILQALMSAVKNGKKVTVFVELKARFDEANNIKWAKQMQAAGVKVFYSIPNLKVHAKVALVKQRNNKHPKYIGLFSTGNLNESTSGTYADHILLTAHQAMLHDLEKVFVFLTRRRAINPRYPIHFKHLLVAQFNLAQVFLDLIDQEISNAKKGLLAEIIVKVNNLEEKTMINKLYEASNAGVKIRLIVRSICCLIPGVAGMSDNIKVTRIVGRYLEHTRVFIFHNNGEKKIYMGSADWMNRNIHHRIEVCFPVYKNELKQRIRDIIDIQTADESSVQENIYQYCKNKYQLQCIG